MNSITRLSLLAWLAVFPVTGFAVTIDVTVNAGPFSNTQTATSGFLNPTVSSGYSTATGYINDAGYMAVQATGDGANYSANAVTTYSKTFTNTGAGALNYDVGFLVFNGVIASNNYFGDTLTDWTLADYSADISVGGSSLWYSTGTLSRPIGGVSSFTGTGTSLGGSYISTSVAAAYSWNEYYGTVSFNLSPGASTEFKYVMSVATQGNITCIPTSGGGEVGCTNSGPGSAFSLPSQLGDPFTVGSPVITDVTTTVVPVPAALWLFGSGLLGLIGLARHRRM